ncbi:helix-turn-helix transcriptional regulator [Alteribacter populi]|uniref:helix-turn-helix transcriptional regulator n=1 Tax=Alteribacter populi TaxID=2011011 RepID=UPI000BBAF914|nr:helix-turn-helix transcriptional regulator [Alteribacter populi]
MIGDRIKELRIEKDLSVEELADGILSPKYIQDIEHNIRHIPDDILPELASRLGTSVDSLLGIEKETNIRKANELLDSALRYTYRDLLDLAKDNILQAKGLEADFSKELRVKLSLVECLTLIKEEEIDDAYNLIQSLDSVDVERYNDLYFIYLRIYGVIHFYREEFWKAIMSFHQAINVKVNFEKHPFEVGVSYFNLGMTYAYIGNLSWGEQHLKKAESIFQDIGEIKQLTDTYINLGNIYYRRRDYEDALDIYKKAQNLLIYNSDLRTSSFIFNNIGLVYLELKNFKKAIEYGTRSLSLKKKLNSFPTDIMNTLEILTKSHLYSNEKEMAEFYIKEIQSYLPKVTTSMTKGHSYATIASYYKTIGNTAKYIEFLNGSIDTFINAELLYYAAKYAYELGKETGNQELICKSASLFYQYHHKLENKEGGN